MRKMSVIVATLFVFVLAGCTKNVKVNLPKAGPDAAKMAQELADYVVENGEQDPTCPCKTTCYQVAHSSVTETSDFKIDGNIHALAWQDAATKKNKLVSIGIFATIDDLQYDKQFNLKVIFIDNGNGPDGVLESMTYLVMDQEFINTLLYIEYQEGKIMTCEGVLGEFAKEGATPESIQWLYEETLSAFLADFNQ